MRFWIDTEFIEDGWTIDLISIGVFSEDRRKYYAEIAECDLSRASPWVVENVIPHLSGKKSPRAQVASEIIEFMGGSPEIWGYYADYDWVALCQLFGRMIDLPKGWPMYCRDVKQLADSLGNPPMPKAPLQEHNALADAIWCAQAWGILQAHADQILRDLKDECNDWHMILVKADDEKYREYARGKHNGLRFAITTVEAAANRTAHARMSSPK